MLDISVIEQPNSIEELFAKEFEKTNKQPMDDFTTEMLVKLSLSKSSPYKLPEEEKPFLYKLMEKRISVVHDFELDDRTLLFLCCICKSADVCVMYIWYLQYESKKRNMKQISFEDFCLIFPVGFPSEEDLSLLWVKQKVYTKGLGSDNLLDYPQAGKSLF